MTLTAFLASLDRLLRPALAGELQEQTYLVYVSPLRALSNRDTFCGLMTHVISFFCISLFCSFLKFGVPIPKVIRLKMPSLMISV